MGKWIVDITHKIKDKSRREIIYALFKLLLNHWPTNAWFNLRFDSYSKTNENKHQTTASKWDHRRIESPMRSWK